MREGHAKRGAGAGCSATTCQSLAIGLRAHSRYFKRCDAASAPSQLRSGYALTLDRRGHALFADRKLRPERAGVAVVRRWLSLQSSLLLQPTKRLFLQSSQKSQRVARASANLPAPHKNLKHGAQPVGGSTSKRMPRVPPGAVASGRQRSGSTVPAPSQSRFSPDCRRAARTVRQLNVFTQTPEGENQGPSPALRCSNHLRIQGQGRGGLRAEGFWRVTPKGGFTKRMVQP